MLKKTQLVGVLVSVASLSACSMYNPGGYTNDQSYQYQGTPLYPETYDTGGQYENQVVPKQQVMVPESYHVGVDHGPTPSKDRDRLWVNNQNPQGYTIELAEGEKASQVAKTLVSAPKNQRMAEVSAERNGKIYYKGLYGSYSTYEAAQQSLASLPAELKQGASIKPWSTLQH